MNTSLQPYNVRADRTAVADAARRASIQKADAENEAQFQDLLSDRKAREAADGAASEPQPARPAVTHRPAVETASAPADAANPSAQPLPAVSVQQAMLAVSHAEDPSVDEAPDHLEASNAAGDPGTDRVTNDSLPTAPPLIDPHGPPVTLDDGSGATPAGSVKTPLVAPHSPPVLDDGGQEPLPTGGVKTPAIAPHGPPVSIDDGDPTPTDLIKTPAIDPHGPPVSIDGDPTPTDIVKTPGVAPHGPPPVAADPAPPTGIQDKPLLVSPHGPPVNDPTPQVQVRERPAASAGQADVVYPANLASATPLNTTAAAPGQASVNPVPVSATTAYTTTIPVRDATPADTRPALLPMAEAPAASTPLITTAAQAQLAASLTADASENFAGAGLTAFSTPRSANLAARVGQTSLRPSSRSLGISMQLADSEEVNSDNNTDGTAVAKRLDNVMAYPSTLENATGRTPWSSPDQDAFGATGSPDDWSSDSLRGRAMDGDAARASAATTPASGSSTTAAAQMPSAAASAAPSTGIVQVDRMEALLQTVQQTATQAQFDGTGQVELRVRLAGVADDVTVRVQLDENRQAQVSFQTGSPELRAALEQGWNDLTASTATAGEASAASASDLAASSPAPSDSYRDSRQVFTATASSTSEPATRRWSGYA